MITAALIALGIYASYIFGQHSQVSTTQNLTIEQPLPAPKGLKVTIENTETKP